MGTIKRLFRHAAILTGACILLITASSKRASAQPGVTVSFQTFYDDLSPYGQWVNDPQYGNVWVPDEGNDFRPYYSRGHWALTDYGNTWVSDERWGWATYHYGRWTYNPYYGWIWVPGYDWAPAWVDWRYGGGNCGWAPLAPGISIGVSYYSCPDDWWVFVGPQYLYRTDFYHDWRGPRYNNTYIHQTTIYNNTYVDNSTHVRYNYGPRSSDIQNYTHQPVQTYHLTGGARPGAPVTAGRNITMFRPEVNRATVSSARPTKVMAAPRPIGRPEASNTAVGTQPAFRSVMHGQAPAPQRGNPAQNTTRPTAPNRGMGQQPGRVQQPVNNRPVQQPVNHAAPQPMNRGQMNNNRPQQPVNHAAPQPMNRGQMNNNRPQQPQPNRTAPQPMNRGQMNNGYNRPAPQPYNRPQPVTRPQQPMNNRPMPQPQMNRPQPQPQPMGGGHPGGGAPPHMEGGGGHPEGGRR